MCVSWMTWKTWSVLSVIFNMQASLKSWSWVNPLFKLIQRDSKSLFLLLLICYKHFWSISGRLKYLVNGNFTQSSLSLFLTCLRNAWKVHQICLNASGFTGKSTQGLILVILAINHYLTFAFSPLVFTKSSRVSVVNGSPCFLSSRRESKLNPFWLCCHSLP